MKINIGNDFLLKAILVYPILLASLFLFDLDSFVITAPYFFLVLIVLFTAVVLQNRLVFKIKNSVNVILTVMLVAVSLINFSTLRFSLVILFSVYLFVIHLFLSVVFSEGFHINKKLLDKFFISFLLCSFFFLFLDHSYMLVGNRYMGFTGSPTTFSGILVTVFIVLDATLSPFGKKRLLYIFLVLLFVYLSKTRLVLLFFATYPLLYFLVKRKALNFGTVFLVFFGVLFFVYVLYGLVIEKFPELITLRYKDARDASFGLRFELYKIIESDFYSGNIWEILFGKGNEHSRLLIIQEKGKDLFPHNDFVRVINDWGVIGAMTFFILLYRLAVKNITSLFISLLYLILWYSNMVFNLFLISILLITAFNEPIKSLRQMNYSKSDIGT